MGASSEALKAVEKALRTSFTSTAGEFPKGRVLLNPYATCEAVDLYPPSPIEVCIWHWCTDVLGS